MKTKKLLAVFLCFALVGGANGALVNTIKVTTFSDENGENPSACSLREAIKSVNDKIAFGGCEPGNRGVNNALELQAGTYNLTLGSIYVSSAVQIKGAETKRPENINPYTNAKPLQLRPDQAGVGSKIVASSVSRVFFTVADLTLVDLVITGNASATVPPSDSRGDGGLIYANSSLVLDNVVAEGGGASRNGGAIFITGTGHNLSITNVTLRNNTASGTGGAVAFDCESGFVINPVHALTINSSYIGSNTSAGSGAIEICGDSTVTMSATTVALNNSGPSNAALQYKLPASVIGTPGNLSIQYSTFVQNTEYAISLDPISKADISSSVIAFNGVGGCRLLGDDAVLQRVSRRGNYNAVDDPAAIPPAVERGCQAFRQSGSVIRTIPVGTLISDVFEMPAAYHGGLTLNYLPKEIPSSSPSYVFNQGEAISTCNFADQRGVLRRSGTRCDIGAVERMSLTANNDTAVAAVKRMALVDVLANANGGGDSFGESLTGANEWDPSSNVFDLVSKPADAACEWDNKLRQVKVFKVNATTGQPSGAVTPEGSPIVCTYRVRDMTNGVPNGYSNTATISVTINNAPPNALNDTVTRAIGQAEIVIDPLLNDNDLADEQDSPSAWPEYSIFIANKPSLGILPANKNQTGNCPDTTATNQKICYKPPLNYLSSYPDSSFTDSFTYVVYDADGKASLAATVTIKGEDDTTGGSLDLYLAALLSLLLLRKLK